jgi:NAD(P)H-hydrate repair Nnr-like enzyme with NAD(P)H-hydrate dehydratase domain
VAALLAQELDAFTAAAAAVWLHAQAGREAARRIGTADAVIASDVIAALPAARARAAVGVGDARGVSDAQVEGDG